MGLVEALKTEREVMESELKGITFDMCECHLVVCVKVQPSSWHRLSRNGLLLKSEQK